MSHDGEEEAPAVRRRDRNVTPTPVLPEADPSAIAESEPVVDRAAPAPALASGDLDAAVDAHEASASIPGARAMRLRRRLARGLVLVAVAGAVYFVGCLAQVWLVGRDDDRGPVDAIVVMGAAQYDGTPSPQLAARLDHVLELWPDDVAPLVVVTGGNIPGDRFTEAESSAAYLVERGIPADVIVLEDAGSNSFESLDSVAEMLEVRGVDEVVIVTDPYHALRSRLIAEEVGLQASVSSTDTSVVTGFDSVARHVKEAGGVAVGRVIGFERLTDIVG